MLNREAQVNKGRTVILKTVVIMLLLTMVVTLTGCGEKTSALVGEWERQELFSSSNDSWRDNDGSYFPGDIELLSDGTGIFYTHEACEWKTEDERLYITISERTFPYKYKISDSILTLVYEPYDNDLEWTGTYKKK